MTNKRKLLIGAGLLLVTVGYCASKKPSGDLEEPQAKKASSGGDLTVSEVPLVADFEKSVNKSITPDNYRKKLRELQDKFATIDPRAESDAEDAVEVVEPRRAGRRARFVDDDSSE